MNNMLSCIKQDIHQTKQVTNGTITQPRPASLSVKVTLLAVVGSDCKAKRLLYVSFTDRPRWGPLRFVWKGEFATFTLSRRSYPERLRVQGHSPEQVG